MYWCVTALQAMSHLKRWRGCQNVPFTAEITGRGEKTVVVAAVIKTLVTKSLTRRFSHLNPDQYNGACLLGLRGTVIKSHGAANQRAFAVAIEQAVQAVQRQVPQRIAARLESVYPAGFEPLDDGKGVNLRAHR